MYKCKKSGANFYEKIVRFLLQKLTKYTCILAQKNCYWIWIASNWNRNRTIDFDKWSAATSILKIQQSSCQIGNREFATYLRIAKRLKKAYKIRILCADKIESYTKYKLSEIYFIEKHQTSLIESTNSFICNYLARFNRKTKRYSKSVEMIFWV